MSLPPSPVNRGTRESNSIPNLGIRGSTTVRANVVDRIGAGSRSS